MAKKKISQTPVKSSPALEDIVPIVDTEASPIRTKHTTFAQIVDAFGLLSSADLSGFATEDYVDTALTGKQDAGDYASLVGGKVPAEELPSYVDDVIEVANYAALPITGETDKIYVTIDIGRSYRWSGSVYVEINPGLVTSVASRTGDVVLVKGDVGLGNVDNTSDVNKPISTLQAAAIDAKAPIESPSFTGTVTVDDIAAPADEIYFVTADETGALSSTLLSLEAGETVYFLEDEADPSISGYKVMDNPAQLESIATVTQSTVAEGQIIQSWITESGLPGVTFVPAGVWQIHLNAFKTGGSRQVRIYNEVYLRTSGGTETLLGTTANSIPLTDASAVLPAFSIYLAEQTLLATDRIVTKTRIRLVGGGSDPTSVSIRYSGTTGARLSTPAQVLSLVDVLRASNNLSDVVNASDARTNLGVAYGTAPGTVAEGDHVHGDITNDGRWAPLIFGPPYTGSGPGYMRVDQSGTGQLSVGGVEAEDITGLSTVATTGEYSDLLNIPSEFTPEAHSHGSINNDGTIGQTTLASDATGPKTVTFPDASGTVLVANSGQTNLSFGGGYIEADFFRFNVAGDLVAYVTSPRTWILPDADGTVVLDNGAGVINASGTASVDYVDRGLFDSIGGLSINWEARLLRDPSGTSSVRWADRLLADTSTNTTLDWQACYLYDSTGFQSINWVDRYLYDSSGNNSVDWQNRNLQDATNVGSIDWGNRSLVDSSGNNSVDWATRYLHDSTGNNSIDWQNRSLQDASNVYSIDWVNRSLQDSTGNNSVDWTSRYLIDSTGGSTAIDWGGRYLQDTFSTTSLDWQNRYQFDSSGTGSIDWGSRYLQDSSGATVVDWGNRSVYDAIAVLALDWGNRYLFDSSGNNSIDWDGRYLHDSTGTTNMNWSSSLPSFPNGVESLSVDAANGYTSLGGAAVFPFGVAFDSGGFTTTLSHSATATRAITLPDADGTVALVGDAPTAHASSHAIGGSDPVVVSQLGSVATLSGTHSKAISLDATTRTVAQNNALAIMGGNTGIGTLTPGTTLEVARSGGSTLDSCGLRLTNPTSGSASTFNFGVGNATGYDQHGIVAMNSTLVAVITPAGSWQFMSSFDVANNVSFRGQSNYNAYLMMNNGGGTLRMSCVTLMEFQVSSVTVITVAATYALFTGDIRVATNKQIRANDVSTAYITLFTGAGSHIQSYQNSLQYLQSGSTVCGQWDANRNFHVGGNNLVSSFTDAGGVIVAGAYARSRLHGQMSSAGGRFANTGDAQDAKYHLRNTTTDAATATTLFLDGSSLRLTIPAQSCWSFTIRLTAYNSTDGLGASYSIRGGIRRDNSNSTALTATVVTETFAEGAMSGCAVAVTADDTNEALQIAVNGLAAKTIRWHAVVETSEVCAGAAS